MSVHDKLMHVITKAQQTFIVVVLLLPPLTWTVANEMTDLPTNPAAPVVWSLLPIHQNFSVEEIFLTRVKQRRFLHPVRTTAHIGKNNPPPPSGRAVRHWGVSRSAREL